MPKQTFRTRSYKKRAIRTNNKTLRKKRLTRKKLTRKKRLTRKEVRNGGGLRSLFGFKKTKQNILNDIDKMVEERKKKRLGKKFHEYFNLRARSYTKYPFSKSRFIELWIYLGVQKIIIDGLIKIKKRINSTNEDLLDFDTIEYNLHDKNKINFIEEGIRSYVEKEKSWFPSNNETYYIIPSNANTLADEYMESVMKTKEETLAEELPEPEPEGEASEEVEEGFTSPPHIISSPISSSRKTIHPSSEE
jgi:hypothetical protein